MQKINSLQRLQTSILNLNRLVKPSQIPQAIPSNNLGEKKSKSAKPIIGSSKNNKSSAIITEK